MIYFIFSGKLSCVAQRQLSQLRKFNHEEILIQAAVKKKILQLEIELKSTDHHSNRLDEMQIELFKEKQEADICGLWHGKKS
jgi:hypothetical protein